jgi:ComEC/Rec2-related protein
MVQIFLKNSVASVNSSLERFFPGLRHWLRMPGLLSWAAVAAGTLLAFRVSFHTCTGICHTTVLFNWVVLPAMVLLPVAGILLRSPFFRFSSFFLFAVLFCIFHRSHQTDTYRFLSENTGASKPVSLVGKVTSPLLPYYENFHFLLKIDSIVGSPSQPLRGVTVSCVSPSEPPQYGKITVRGVFMPPEPRRNPFEYDEFTATMAQGVWGTFTAGSCRTLEARRSPLEKLSSAFRNVTLAALRKITDYDNRALLQASFLGDTEFLSPFIKDIFRKSGIYHLIAISGLNTAMLAAALYFFLRLFPLGRTATHLICIAALWAYLPFVGFIPSLFRATIMTSCVIAATLFEKKNYALHTLGLAGTFWFLLSPESLFDAGYQLSFAATAGILTLFQVLNRWTPKPVNRFLRSILSFLFSAFYISLASFLTTAPILLYHFGTVSYFGLLANLVAVAAMTVSMWAFFAGLFFQMVLPFLAAVPLWVSERFLDIVVGTGKLAGLFSWSRVAYPVPPPEIILLFALFLIGFVAVCRERVKSYFLLSLAAAALFVPADLLIRRSLKSSEAVRFAVPKCSLLGIKWPDNRVWIVSPDPNRSLPFLLERHVIPWVRHRTRSTRAEALVIPDDFAVNADTLFERNDRAAPERLITIPDAPISTKDSLLSIFTPCSRCTLAVCRYAAGTGVRITAPSFDTTLYFVEDGPAGRRKSLSLKTSALRSAVVMTSGRKGIRPYETVPLDHPVR